MRLLFSSKFSSIQASGNILVLSGLAVIASVSSSSIDSIFHYSITSLKTDFLKDRIVATSMKNSPTPQS